MQDNLAALVKAGSVSPTNQKALTVEKEKTVYNGYFSDDQVKDRSLKDWQGSWQAQFDVSLQSICGEENFGYKLAGL